MVKKQAKLIVGVAILVTAIVGLKFGIIFFLTHKYPTYQIGNFTYVPKDKNYSPYHSPSDGNIVSKTKIEQKYNVKDETGKKIPCTRVENTYMALFTANGFGLPHISVIAWNTKDLSFYDKDSENRFGEYVNGLGDIPSINSEQVENELKDYFETAKDPEDFPSITPVGLLGCGGEFHLPIYFKTISTPQWDHAFYIEALESQDVFAWVERYLVVNIKEDWLILSANEVFPFEKNIYETCLGIKEEDFYGPNKEYDKEIYSKAKGCSYKIWQQINTFEKTQAWITQMLDSINYSPSK